jgi:molecular chaperone GrpE
MDAARADAGDRAVEADEVLRLRQAIEEERQRNLRLLADFDNFRRRVGREKERASGDARRAALLPLLQVLDTLERALASGSTDADFYEGVAATRRLFESALREAGAEPLEAVGQPFDPTLHEAVGAQPSEEVEPGTVVREVRRGWRLPDGLLRPAQVVVAAEEESARPWR